MFSPSRDQARLFLIAAWDKRRSGLPQTPLETLSADNAMLREALEEIAERGPIDGYSAPSAILLRLVGSQSVARAALAKGGV